MATSQYGSRTRLYLEDLPELIFGYSEERYRISAQSLPQEFLRLLVVSEYDHDLFSFSSRRRQLLPWGETLANTAASSGFALVTSASSAPLLTCVSCGASTAPTACTFQHRMCCEFRRVRHLCSSSPPSRSSVLTRRLERHIRQELQDCKAAVAREFGYDEDEICTVLAQQFLTKRKPFPDAGCLVDSLSETGPLASCYRRGVIANIASYVTSDMDNDLYSMSTSPKLDKCALMRETCALLAKTKCRKCWTEPAEFVLLPCAHLNMCTRCLKSTDSCPTCGEIIVTVIRTYRA